MAELEKEGGRRVLKYPLSVSFALQTESGRERQNMADKQKEREREERVRDTDRQVH